MSSTRPTPPRHQQTHHTVTSPHGDRDDEYYWMRDDNRSRPDVIDALNAENEYVDQTLGHLTPLRDELYNELIARLRPDDESVPVKDGAWWYGMHYQAGNEYPAYTRRRTPDGEPQVLLDLQHEANGHDYYAVADLIPSPDDRLLAYTEDTVSRRQYTVKFRDLETGHDLPDAIPGCEGAIAWADDGTTILYIEQDPETLIGVRVKAHVVGTNPSDDRTVYENTDRRFYPDVRRSRSGRYLYIDLEHTDTSETLFAPTNDPQLTFKPVLERSDGHFYTVDDLDGDLLIRTNHEAPNFRIIKTSIDHRTETAAWVEIIPHDPHVFIEASIALRAHLVVNVREGGQLRLKVLPWRGGPTWTVASDDPSSVMYLGPNREQETGTLRYVYTSLTTPMSDMELDLATGERRLLKRAYAGDDFDHTRYTSDYLHVTATDGTAVPVTTLRLADAEPDSGAPALIYAYGSYGISSDPVFRASWLSLVNRGFVVALAHVRGGQELGRAWYESGRQLSKRNTFTDFIDVTQGLIDRGLVAADRVFAQGGSAGGLLMGAIANMAPHLYRGIVAQVPFVDVVTTMLDPTIPLTLNEYDEWGDPAGRAAYDYMLSYSPYDNVGAHRYPAILVLTGLHDSQVQYWEPLKWVARLRDRGTGNQPVLLRTRMDAGHGGVSGRYRQYEDTALIQAWMIDQANPVA